MRLIDFFDKGVARGRERPFVLDETVTVTYGEAQSSSRKLAGALRGLGVPLGTRVAILSSNTARACEAVIGLLRAECVWVTVASMGTDEEIVAALRSTEAEALFFGVAHGKRVPAIVSACPMLKWIFCIEEEAEGYASLADLRAAYHGSWGEATPPTTPLATLFSSGGTSGRPKGVMMTHRAWEVLIASSAINLGQIGGVRLIASPLTQTAGASGFLAELAKGMTYVLLEQFEPERLLHAIETHRVTHLFLPPAAVRLVMTHPHVHRYDRSSLRSLVYGGAPIAPETVLHAMDVFGPVMATGFAQTETGGPVTYLSPDDHVAARDGQHVHRLASCGRETLLARVEIMGDDGVLLDPDHEGEVVVRSSHLMEGYYRDGGSWTDEGERIDGWHCTGDVGRKDADGFVYIVDRKRDMIITRGYNVFPTEIEKVLEAQPGVLGCAVVGAPHDTMGEVVKAVIEVSAGATIDVKTLRKACRERLAGQKVPVSIEIWPRLPRNSAGKVLRRQVRKVFWDGRDRQV